MTFTISVKGLDDGSFNIEFSNVKNIEELPSEYKYQSGESFYEKDGKIRIHSSEKLRGEYAIWIDSSMPLDEELKNWILEAVPKACRRLDSINRKIKKEAKRLKRTWEGKIVKVMIGDVEIETVNVIYQMNSCEWPEARKSFKTSGLKQPEEQSADFLEGYPSYKLDKELGVGVNQFGDGFTFFSESGCHEPDTLDRFIAVLKDAVRREQKMLNKKYDEHIEL